MIEKINLNNILFIDIETVPEEQNFKVLDIYSVLFLDGIAQIRLFIIKIIWNYSILIEDD